MLSTVNSIFSLNRSSFLKLCHCDVGANLEISLEVCLVHFCMYKQEKVQNGFIIFIRNDSPLRGHVVTGRLINELTKQVKKNKETKNYIEINKGNKTNRTVKFKSIIFMGSEKNLVKKKLYCEGSRS